MQPAGKELKFRGGVARAKISGGKADVMRVRVGKAVSNPSVRPGKRNLYWGDLHTHSLVYDGTGTPAEAYQHGRDVTRLDFQSVSEHSFFDPAAWAWLQEAARAYNEPGRFVTMLGYEARTIDYGDINFYFPDARGVQPPATTFAGKYSQFPLKDFIKTLGESKVLVLPHCHNKPSNDYPADFARTAMPLMEIYSQWGNFELAGRPFLRTGELTVAPMQAAVDNLKSGLRFGFSGGSDNHSCHAGHGRGMRFHEEFLGGLTGVYASSLTRAGIYKALMQRRCFATTGSRMVLDFSAAGVRMGGQAKAGAAQRQVKATVHGDGKLARVVVIRNGDEVHSVDCRGALDYELDWTDAAAAKGLWLDKTKYTDGPFMFYYVRVEQQDGQIGWTSPVWLDT